MTPGETVRAFINAMDRKDLDAACALVTADCEYDNVPMAKAFGPEGIRTTLEPFFATCSGVRFDIHYQAESGDVVMNERTDNFEIAGKWIGVGVAGLFVLRDGKIALWRDYFDLAMFQNALAGG